MSERRAPFQVLVFPYRLTLNALRYALFRRADLGVWQGLAGGGEGLETPDEAAVREAHEEACIPTSSSFLRLRSVGWIPAAHFAGRASWGPDVQEIPEHAFGVAVASEALPLSPEHTEMAWLDIDAALARLEWASNRDALRELHERLTGSTG